MTHDTETTIYTDPTLEAFDKEVDDAIYRALQGDEAAHHRLAELLAIAEMQMEVE